jgi:muramoyltetrapeptide carboxypeptidase
LIHQPDFQGVRGIVIGRFQRETSMSNEKLTHIVKTKKELKKIPVVTQLDFGHTTPQFSFPIGGKARIDVDREGRTSVRILIH